MAEKTDKHERRYSLRWHDEEDLGNVVAKEHFVIRAPSPDLVQEIRFSREALR